MVERRDSPSWLRDDDDDDDDDDTSTGVRARGQGAAAPEVGQSHYFSGKR